MIEKAVALSKQSIKVVYLCAPDESVPAGSVNFAHLLNSTGVSF
jgi:hypothetical protein